MNRAVLCCAKRAACCVAALLLMSASGALAHKPSDSYLSLDAASMQGTWDIALRDLDDAIGLDADGDGAVTWGELRRRESVLTAYALSRLAVQSDGAACKLQPRGLAVDGHSDGAYAVLRFALDCAKPASSLSVHYSLLFDLDPTHRGLLRVTSPAGVNTAVLGPDSATLTLPVAPPGALRFAARGVLALFSQLSALLVLLALLLRRRPLHERAATAASFALALALGLALSGVAALRLAPRALQAAVLLSVAAAVVNLAWPMVRERLWAPAFAFGLLHGFDFAQRFAAVPLSGASVSRALPCFSLGIVLAIAAVALVVCAPAEAAPLFNRRRAAS